MPSPARRLLAVGLDGATFDLLDPLIEAGDLPFLGGLLARGRRARLTSVFPPKTIPAWYSFATGRDPGELGIFGFTEPDGGPGRSRVVQTFRPAEAIWDRLSRRGVRVGVLNFPLRAGYPLNGFIVPGMLTERPQTYPTGLRDELETALGGPYLPELPPYRESDRAGWLDLAGRGVAQQAAATEFLVDRFRPDFLFVLIRETDRVQHQHWAELDRPVARIPDDLRQFYRGVDAAVARIDGAFRSVGDPATTVVLSDHGHGAARSDFFTNRWLEEEGFLVFRADRSRAPVRRRLVSRLLLALDRYPVGRRLLGPIVDRLRGSSRREWVGRLITGQSTFEEMAGRIDWERTVAYSYPVPEGIYLNRYHPGLTPEAGRTIITEVAQRLRAFPEARIEVLEPEAIYKGRRFANAPALLLRIDGLATEPRMDFSYPRPLLRDRPGFFYGTGVHRMDGILVVAQDDGTPEPLPPVVSLLDVAPRIFASMGMTPSAEPPAAVAPGQGG